MCAIFTRGRYSDHSTRRKGNFVVPVQKTFVDAGNFVCCQENQGFRIRASLIAEIEEFVVRRTTFQYSTTSILLCSGPIETGLRVGAHGEAVHRMVTSGHCGNDSRSG